MPTEPVILFGGPTSGHSDSGALSHIGVKSPKPIAVAPEPALVYVGRCLSERRRFIVVDVVIVDKRLEGVAADKSSNSECRECILDYIWLAMHWKTADC